MTTEEMTIEELLALAFPGGLPKVDPRLLPTASRDTIERQRIDHYVRMFERGEVGGDLRRQIYENRVRYTHPDDRIKAEACSRLLQIAEEKQPTPLGFGRYL